MRILLSKCEVADPRCSSELTKSTSLAELVLHTASDSLCAHLHPGPSLESLTLVGSLLLSGADFKPWQIWRSSHLLIALASQQHFTGCCEPLPMLKLIAFHGVELQHEGLLELPTAALQVLANGQNLEYVDLQGVHML